MRFIVVGEPREASVARFTEGLVRTLQERGHTLTREDDPDLRLALNLVEPRDVRPFRRRSRSVFVASVLEKALGDGTHPLLEGYPLLVRSLSNLFILLSPNGGGYRPYFITPEQGFYSEPPEPAASFFERVYRRIAPLAESHLIIDNEFRPDLPPELWEGDSATRDIVWASRRLAELDLLPAPFPIHEMLSERDLRHLNHLFGLGGLSYGNVSARRDRNSFWMSASGVDKSRLSKVGEEILLVTGFDPERQTIILSVPPHARPRRVSVDAIEHWTIYQEHPEVGAILHVHAWMEGVPETSVNYPCGTIELARSVADQVRAAPDPARAVVGLKNHGLTITGSNLREIFARIEGRLLKQIPMT